jgi:hypothetical protein
VRDSHGEAPWFKDMLIENEEAARASGSIVSSHYMEIEGVILNHI